MKKLSDSKIPFAIAITIICFLSSTNTQSQHKLHTDGIEPYYKPLPLENYLKSIDPQYLPYMFASEQDMQWWKQAKLGIFVHWAPAAVTEAALSWGRLGSRPHHSSNGKVTKGVPEQEYNDTYKIFNPTKFNAEEWINIWKEAGAKYFVFTAKHHYGFCMWDTKTTDFNIMNTPYGKDVMKDIAIACEKNDIKLMWYYSQPDWTHPLYRKEIPHTEYNEKILFPQVRELMTYPGVDGIWFDGLGLPPSRWNSPKLLKIIRDVNPKAIVNHRHGSPQWHMGDFDGPERGVGRFQTNRPWETCDVIGGAWAYNGESEPASKSDVLKALTKIAGNGGNLLLGTGPRPDGSVVDKHVDRLKDLGNYLDTYGKSIYSTQGGPYISAPWGSSTYRDNKIYLHITGNLADKKLMLPQLPAKIVSYKTLTPNTSVKLKNSKNGLSISYNEKVDSINTIIEITIDQEVKNIYPIETTGKLILHGAKLTATSNKSDNFSATNLLPGAKEDFSEGIRIKKSWKPSDEVKKNYLEYEWKKKQKIKQISIKEGRRLDVSKMKKFNIKSWQNNKWNNVYQGTDIGSFFGVYFEKPINTSKLKITFENYNKGLEINKILIYSE